MKSGWIASITLLAFAQSAFAQQNSSVAGLPSGLEGTGRTCSGQFRHTRTMLVWKAPYVQCRSAFSVVQHEGLHWVLKVNKGKSCAFERIDISSSELNNPKSFYWTVTGYVKASELGQTGADSQGCGMNLYSGKS